MTEYVINWEYSAHEYAAVLWNVTMDRVPENGIVTVIGSNRERNVVRT